MHENQIHRTNWIKWISLNTFIHTHTDPNCFLFHFFAVLFAENQQTNKTSKPEKKNSPNWEKKTEFGRSFMFLCQKFPKHHLREPLEIAIAKTKSKKSKQINQQTMYNSLANENSLVPLNSSRLPLFRYMPMIYH